MILERILLPIDFSGSAKHAARIARSMAEVYNATLHIIHVQQDQSVASATLAGNVPSERNPDEMAPNQLMACFVKENLNELKIPFVTKLVGGIPVHSIVNYATDNMIDLIVIGTSRRGAINRYFLGSISTALIENAKCPILIVPRTPNAGEGNK